MFGVQLLEMIIKKFFYVVASIVDVTGRILAGLVNDEKMEQNCTGILNYCVVFPPLGLSEKPLANIEECQTPNVLTESSSTSGF